MSNNDGVDVAALLNELCARLGVCLPQSEHDALVAAPPTDVDELVAAILRADGGDPEAADVRLTRRVRVMVEEHLRDPSAPPPQAPPLDVHPLLYELCVRLGHCLPPEPWDDLMTNPPLEVDAFAEAVFAGEGLDSPRELDSHSWREVRAVVEAHFVAAGLL